MSDALCTRRQQQLVLSATGPSSDSLALDSVIAEILSWLPAKSLLRFRCVCKAWRALISYPYFIRKHLSRINLKIPSSYSLLIREDVFRTVEFEDLFKCLSHDDPLPRRTLDFPVIIDPQFHVRFIDIVGSCNGLICLHLEWDESDAEQPFTYMLWNPCTGDYKVLPHPPLYPYSYHRFLGFGYDSTIDDYKLVLGSNKKRHEFVVVFSLKLGSWRILERLDRYFEMEDEVGCLVNEALHWILLHEGQDTIVTGSKIVSFDLVKEKFVEIPFPFPPNLVPRSDLIAIVGNLNNCLTLCYQTLYGEDERNFKMWMLRDYGVKESWTEVINMVQDADYDYITCISENGEVLMRRVAVGCSLALYNPKEKKYRILMAYLGYLYETATYIATLSSPLIGGTGARA